MFVFGGVKFVVGILPRIFLMYQAFCSIKQNKKALDCLHISIVPFSYITVFMVLIQGIKTFFIQLYLINIIFICVLSSISVKIVKNKLFDDLIY